MPSFVRGSSTSRVIPLARRGSHPARRSLSAGVPRHYPRFIALTGPAATLRSSSPLPAPTLLRELSSRDREGFTCSDPTLRCVLPSLPRRNRPRPASVPPRPMLPSPVLGWLGFRELPHEACLTFDTCGPQRCSPVSQPDLSGDTASCFRHSNASPQLRRFLVLSTSRLSLAGLHRLSAGHAGHGHVRDETRRDERRFDGAGIFCAHCTHYPCVAPCVPSQGWFDLS